jgi:hypothetical protein
MKDLIESTLDAANFPDAVEWMFVPVPVETHPK